ncbi:hypothetical protein C8F01DRAFT_725599 [Mycena amicta]|nr:hypothetical protein C8F01DRAFT_725599 [Mycena amicta]
MTVDYPTDVDDEYWEHPDPSKRFQQPEGKPSQVAFFVSNVKLFAILGRAEKTIYSLQRNERGPAWSQSTVAELDSALNQWLDSIPEHLRWDPHRENSIFSAQSAALYASVLSCPDPDSPQFYPVASPTMLRFSHLSPR